MAILSLLADPFPDWEARTQFAASRDLTRALGETSPRSCSARYVISRGPDAPEFDSPLISVDRLSLRANMLPLLWQNGSSARQFDGEFMHAPTPLAPLRARGDDGTQTSVTITHAVAWEAPELLGNAQARLYRSYTKRAVRLADVIITPTHATARVVQEHYGADLPVQVLQLAAPAEYLAPADAAERRAILGLSDSYLLTTARPGALGRLDWAFAALQADPALPPLVVLDGIDPAANEKGSEGVGSTIPVPEAIADRVRIVAPRELSDVGAVLDGAALLLHPQAFSGTGYTVLGALSASVPVLHSGHPATAELALDGGVAAESVEEFGAELSRLFREEQALQTLSVLACDRSRSFSWQSAAWQLWETHANL